MSTEMLSSVTQNFTQLQPLLFCSSSHVLHTLLNPVLLIYLCITTPNKILGRLAINLG